MAIRHISTILCDNLLRGFDGRLSFIEAFRNIHSPNLPTGKIFGVCVELEGDRGEAFRVSIEGNGLDIVMGEGVMNPPELLEFQQAHLLVAGQISAHFENYGVFEVIVRSGETIIHRTSCGVIRPIETNQAEEDNAE